MAGQTPRRSTSSPRGSASRPDRQGRGGTTPGRQGPRQGTPYDRQDDRAERPRPPRNPADLRRSNSDQRGRSPEIDDDVTGKELDRAAAAQLKTLNDANRGWVAKHLVMAGRLVDIDPAVALEHALAASRRGGRLAVVREAVGLCAYAAGDYAEALRELRTYRRISGDQSHLAVQADCERGLGKPQKAIELSESPEAQGLKGAARVQLALVVSGAHADLGDHGSAVSTLEVPELDIQRAFSYSPELFAAYAEALESDGRGEEAVRWRRQTLVAERALGTGAFEEPEIMDFDEGEAELPTVKDVMGSASAPQSAQEGGASLPQAQETADEDSL
jgi:tetratricopeptide (TPR) repeat protein